MTSASIPEIFVLVARCLHNRYGEPLPARIVTLGAPYGPGWCVQMNASREERGAIPPHTIRVYAGGWPVGEIDSRDGRLLAGTDEDALIQWLERESASAAGEP